METVYQFYNFRIFHQSLRFTLSITSVVSLFLYSLFIERCRLWLGLYIVEC